MSISDPPREGPGWWAGPDWESLVRHAMTLDGNAHLFVDGLDLAGFRALSGASEHWTKDNVPDGNPPFWLIQKACVEAKRRMTAEFAPYWRCGDCHEIFQYPRSATPNYCPYCRGQSLDFEERADAGHDPSRRGADPGAD